MKEKQQYQAKIAMHALDAEMVKTGRQPDRFIRSLAIRIFFSLFRFLRGKMPFATFTPDILLKDGQDLNQYGWDAKILHLPGHTPGSIVILSASGALFSGDILSKKGRVEMSPFIDDENAIKKSIETIKTFPVRIFYPGHGKQFTREELA